MNIHRREAYDKAAQRQLLMKKRKAKERGEEGLGRKKMKGNSVVTDRECDGLKIGCYRAQAVKMARRTVRAYNPVSRKYDGPLVRKKGDAYLVDCNVTGSSKGTEDKSQVLPEGRTSLRVKKYFRLLKSWFEVGTIKDIWQSSGGTMLDRIRREN